MINQIVKDYEIIANIEAPEGYQFIGSSTSAKHIIPDLFQGKRDLSILDIGFGKGELGISFKRKYNNPSWHIDGIDGFYRTCCNVNLFKNKVYRNVWHGLVQDLSKDQLSSYDAICLLDVIEHLDADVAVSVLTSLLEGMGDNCKLIISTPLWFYPQGNVEEGDLEEHKIGIPATSFVDLNPEKYCINRHYLVGTFVLNKNSLSLIHNFVPTTDKSFNERSGYDLINKLGLVIDNQWHTLW